jgi:malonyl-CoA O-methyltransferase
VHYRIRRPGFPLPASSPSPDLSAPVDLQRVRTLFAAPARVAEADFLRREVALRMHERLALVKLNPQRVLDAGCGSGPDLELLQERYAQARVFGLDGALPMLEQALQAQRSASSALQRLMRRLVPPGFKSELPGSALVCADFARLPLRTASLDLLWSNLALHWHPQPDRVFEEWRRALRVDGLLMFSCFGPDTFKELRTAFSELDRAPHVLPFVDMHDFGDMLVNAGFATPVMDMETIVVTYESTDRLLADARAWGGNPLSTRRRGLVGRTAWDRVLQALERERGDDGKLRLTFEVVYGHAFRPAPRTTAGGEAIVRFAPGKK